jgi:hypothetical protein
MVDFLFFYLAYTVHPVKFIFLCLVPFLCVFAPLR